MYNNVSEEFVNLIGDSGRTFKAKLVNGTDGITDIRSISLYQAENGEDNIGIGGCVASYIDCTIGNTTFQLEDTEYELQIGLKIDEENYEYVPIGKFTPKKPDIKSEVTTFIAYDRMMSKGLSYGYFSDIENYPVDAKVILSEIQEQTGIEIDISELPDGVMIDKRKVISDTSYDEEGEEIQIETYENPFEGYTKQEAICYIAQMYGKFAFVDRYGIVRFRWFESSGLQYNRSQYKDDVNQSEKEFTLGVIKCGDLISGSGATGISIDNPVMTQAVLDDVYQKIGGFKCRGISLTLIGDLRIDIGDIIQVYINDEYMDIPVMRLETYFDGGISQKVYVYGSTEDVEEKRGPTTQRIDRMYNELLLVKEIMANKVSADNLEARIATLGFASIKELSAEVAKMGLITADEADIRYLTADSANLKYASIDSLNALQGNFNILNSKAVTTDTISAEVAKLGYVETSKLEASVAELGYIKSGVADLKYANIDLSNITMATIGHFFSTSGIIKDVVVGDQTITGELVGVTIKGDLIEANTIVADKLVIKGDDGLYYKLNTDGVTTEAEQTDYNSLNGSVIRAQSVTADKISVTDLVAFDATIAGFHITDASLYSGAKDSVTNAARGVYLGSDSQVSFGDGTNFIKYYKDTDGNYKLAISAESLTFTTGENIYEELSKIDTTANSASSAAATAQSIANTAIINAATALSTANNAAKTATNFMSYDSTNGLMIGNNISGTLVGYRTQITSSAFNILDSSGTQLASYGEAAVIGDTSGRHVVVGSDGLNVYNGSEKLGQIGYGEGLDENGNKVTAPYYDLGIRKSGSTVGNYSTAEGLNTTANGYCSHAEGYKAKALGGISHAEGYLSFADGDFSHAEGYNTGSVSFGSHAEGCGTIASGEDSHAEGQSTIPVSGYFFRDKTIDEIINEWKTNKFLLAKGDYSHAEGKDTLALCECSHSEGLGTISSGYSSHAGGYYTIAAGANQTAIGKYNVEDTTSAFIIGNGTSETSRSNAFSVDFDGNVKLNGTDLFELIYPVGSIYMSVNNTNPSSLFGGTWVAWGSGRVPVGVNTNDANFSTVEKTGGASTVTLTTTQIPAHAHGLNNHTHSLNKHTHGVGTLKTAENGDHAHAIKKSQFSPSGSTSGKFYVNTDSSSFSSTATNTAGAHTHTISGSTAAASGNTGAASGNTANAGGGGAHSNLQPYITCYMWKRTA